MSEDDLQGLIKPYKQIRPDLSDEGRGTGLWLVLAQEIIALHGGSVLFDSSSEEGNTFGFRVPFCIATPDEQKDADILHIVNSSINQVNNADKSCNSNSIPSRQSERERKYLLVDGKRKSLHSSVLTFVTPFIISQLTLCESIIFIASIHSDFLLATHFYFHFALLFIFSISPDIANLTPVMISVAFYSQ